MNTKLVAATLGTILGAAPAAAWDKPQTTSAKPAAEKTYCMTFDSDTGSRVARVECRTKRDWKRLGVEVEAASSK
jgi:hypothetical protein